MDPRLKELIPPYQTAFQEYIQKGRETSLWKAFEFGRSAIAKGLGVVEVIAIHKDVSEKILFSSPNPLDQTRMARATQFLTEALSPFELTYSAFRFANRALRKSNQFLVKKANRMARSLHDERWKNEIIKGAIMESALDCIITIDHNGKITEFNPAAERTFGYTRSQVVGKPMADMLFSPLIRKQYDLGFSKKTGKKKVPFLNQRTELTAMDAGGKELPVELAVTRIPLKGSSVFTLFLRDISNRKRSEAERTLLLERERVARAEAEKEQERIINILESISDIFVSLDRELRMIYLNREGEKFLGKNQKKRDQVIGRKIWEAFPAMERSNFYRELGRALEEKISIEMEEFYKPYNTWFWIRITPSPEGLSVYLQDITERKAQTRALEFQAMHDALTGLPNRTVFHDRLRQAIVTAHREEKSLAVLILDLDHFKEINDTLGHQRGDLLLKEISPLLEEVLRGSDTLARLGGDEFGILLPAADLEGAKLAARKILKVLESPIHIDGFSFEVGGSIGIAQFPEHGTNADILIQRADVAMYVAKQSRRGFSIYAIDQDPHTPRRLSIIGELRHAIERQQMILHFQPKVSLKTGTILGVEALGRWYHPQLKMMPPDGFIPLLEQTGLIKGFFLWGLNTALSQCRAWIQGGHHFGVAVNLSVRNLRDMDFPNQIGNLLKIWKIDPAQLEFEITESSIMDDPNRNLNILSRLSEMGFRLSIDDFGTGYSSLAQLKRLPVDEIKIDKSFVLDMANDAEDTVIVRSTIDLAHNLGLKVVAEGVENKKILERLVALECDAAQGYYTGPPMPAEELTLWLEKHNHPKENGG